MILALAFAAYLAAALLALAWRSGGHRFEEGGR
jgi:hypothetical protein